MGVGRLYRSRVSGYLRWMLGWRNVFSLRHPSNNLEIHIAAPFDAKISNDISKAFSENISAKDFCSEFVNIARLGIPSSRYSSTYMYTSMLVVSDSNSNVLDEMPDLQGLLVVDKITYLRI